MRRIAFRALCVASALLCCSSVVLDVRGRQHFSDEIRWSWGRADCYASSLAGAGSFSTIRHPINPPAGQWDRPAPPPEELLAHYNVLPPARAVVGVTWRSGDFGFYDRRTPRGGGRPPLPPDVPPASTWRIVTFPLWPLSVVFAALPLWAAASAVRARRARRRRGFPVAPADADRAAGDGV